MTVGRHAEPVRRGVTAHYHWVIYEVKPSGEEKVKYELTACEGPLMSDPPDYTKVYEAFEDAFQAAQNLVD